MKEKFNRIALLFVFLISTYFFWSDFSKNNFGASNLTSPEGWVKVIKVIRGDMISVVDREGNVHNIKLIGVSVPSKYEFLAFEGCFSNEAFEKNKSLTEGKRVFLETDWIDRYYYPESYLRYVYIEDEDKQLEMVNFTLLKEGFARFQKYSYPAMKYRENFKVAETEAKNSKKGLWRWCEAKN